MIDISLIPTSPGCYLYSDKKNIIYIGKAKNLKKRVSSYFNRNLDSKTNALVKNISKVDFIATNSEVEALILENTLIKKHQPKYNINLKDSKQFACLAITDELYPRLVLDRKHEGEKRFGPYTSGQMRDELKELLIKTFKVRTCSKLPKKECLRYHIGLCSAPCIKAITEKQYLESVRNIELVLKGKTKDLIVELTNSMKQYAKEEKFELALENRKQIEALNWLEERQNMIRQKGYDEDIINYVKKDDKIYIILFNVHKGILENKQSFILNTTDIDKSQDIFEEFILRYYTEEKVPKEIILPHDINNSIIEAVNNIRKTNLRIMVPKIGEKKHLLELVNKNIELQFFASDTALYELQRYLKLQNLPEIIECFDISHLAGTNTVASLVQFRQGIPDKSNYRRFKIKSVQGIDDFASIAEVVKRRYTRLLNETQRMPDLIVIDGGKGQLHAALDELRKLELRIPIISIAKKLEEIYVPGLPYPINIPPRTKALKILQRIRDEAHRFAIDYNKKLRKLDV